MLEEAADDVHLWFVAQERFGVLVLVVYCTVLQFVLVIPCRGCVKRASAAARCAGAAPRCLLVLLLAFAMHYCMNFEAQSTATRNNGLGLRPWKDDVVLG